jgi:hypothetical protein
MISQIQQNVGGIQIFDFKQGGKTKRVTFLGQLKGTHWRRDNHPIKSGQSLTDQRPFLERISCE